MGNDPLEYDIKSSARLHPGSWGEVLIRSIYPGHTVRIKLPAALQEVLPSRLSQHIPHALPALGVVVPGTGPH